MTSPVEVAPHWELPLMAAPEFQGSFVVAHPRDSEMTTWELGTILSDQAQALCSRFGTSRDGRHERAATTFDPYLEAAKLQFYYNKYSAVMKTLIIKADLSNKRSAEISYVLPVTENNELAVVNVVEYSLRVGLQRKSRRLGKRTLVRAECTTNEFYQTLSAS